MTELQVPLIRRAIDPISFTVPGDPVPKGRPRARVMKKRVGGKMTHVPQIYTPEETRAAEQAFLMQAKPYRPPAPLSGPLRVDLLFVVPIPVSYTKAMHAACASGAVLPTSRPDRDNYEKLVLDALNGEFWLDDSQVCAGETRKIYGLRPRTEVTITQILPGESE